MKKKEHDYLICIDSDGCAMDTMNSKHFYCFGPEWVKQYGLEDIQEEALKYWNQINLYSKTRGINRFKGLAMGLEWAKEKGYETEGQEEFVAWTKEAPELSNPALLAQCQKKEESLYGTGTFVEYSCQSCRQRAGNGTGSILRSQRSIRKNEPKSGFSSGIFGKCTGGGRRVVKV